VTGDLSEQEIDLLLNREVVGRLGCHDGERTYVVPISYVYHDGYIHGHSGLGMKVDMLRAGGEVCFQIDHIDDLATWQSVILWGEYEELTGREAEESIALLVDRLAPLIGETGGRLPHPWDDHHGSAEHLLHRASRHGVIFRIKITSKTGRYEKR